MPQTDLPSIGAQQIRVTATTERSRVPATPTGAAASIAFARVIRNEDLVDATDRFAEHWCAADKGNSHHRAVKSTCDPHGSGGKHRVPKGYSYRTSVRSHRQICRALVRSR